KLLRRSPTGSPILCTVLNPSFVLPVKTTQNFISLGVYRNTHFLCLGFKPKTPHTPLYIMPPTATLRFHPSVGVAAVKNNPYTSTAVASSTISSQVFSANNCRICRCSIENANGVRAWVGFKNRRSGSLWAWFSTIPDEGLSVAAAKGSETSESYAVENGGENEKEWWILRRKSQ
ncbi:unnamed protein product, partial [Ilex paraguariensis]